MTLKTTYVRLFACTLFCLFYIARASSQPAIVTGHVTAEVVESVSATSKAVTGISLRNVNNHITDENAGKDCLNEETFNLGNIMVTSGTNITCSLVIQPVNVIDSKGNVFIIDPTLKSSIHHTADQAKSVQTIQINGTALLSQNQASGLYKGSYSLIFANN